MKLDINKLHPNPGGPFQQDPQAPSFVNTSKYLSHPPPSLPMYDYSGGYGGMNGTTPAGYPVAQSKC